MTNPLVINDPVYGFTVVPRGLLCDIIRHPYFQRLHRIRQLGLSGLVYPGAQHTRFQHSLGAYHLMCRAIDSLTGKGHFIFDSEIEGAEAAILMHDLGHGPFSHVLEHALTKGVSHEQISLMMMERINAGEDPQGPQTMGSGDGQSATIGDLSDNSNTSWSDGTAVTSGSASAEGEDSAEGDGTATVQ